MIYPQSNTCSEIDLSGILYMEAMPDDTSHAPDVEIILMPYSTDKCADHQRITLSPSASTLEFKRVVKIEALINLSLREEIAATIENDDDGFIAKSLNLPLYGFGDFPNEAIENLKHEIESCYFDLSTSDDFSQDWLQHKSYLVGIVEHSE